MRAMRLTSNSLPLALGLVFLLAGCGASAPVASAPSSPPSARPSGSPSAPASAAAAGEPEKKHMEIASPVDTSGTMPMRVAQDAGYFAKHGIDVTVNVVSAAVAAQGLTAGSFDLYQGGTTPV